MKTLFTFLLFAIVSNMFSQNTHLFNPKTPYGDQPAITQLDGHGNNNNLLELKQESIDTILSGFPWRDYSLDYKAGFGPIDIKVINSDNLQEGIYYLKFDSVTLISTTGIIKENDGKAAKWFIYNESGDTVFADHWINYNNEQLIPEWGISVTMNYIEFPGDETENGGFQAASIEFSDPSKPWLKFIEDTDIASSPTNWIRSGTMESPDNSLLNDYGDENEYFEQILEGKWAPYKMASHTEYGPAYITGHSLITYLRQRLASVDIVITSDQSKWTRCPVFEMCENDSIDTNGDGENDDIAPGPSGDWKFDLRGLPSVDKNGINTNIGSGEDTLTNDNLSNYIGSYGMSWFPGYAIDVETGVRLNMGFGENSWYVSQNGNDMLWNPTSKLYSDLWESTGGTDGYPYFGGMHNVYIFGVNQIETSDARRMPGYDEGLTIFQRMDPSVSNGKRDVFRNAMWVAMPYLDSAFNLLDTDVTIKIRMSNPYKANVNYLITTDTLNSCKPMYKIDFSELSGIKNFTSEQSSTTVYPNPAKDIVNFIISNDNREDVSLELFDITGKKIDISGKIISSSTFHFQIDISQFQPGIYLYGINTKNGIKDTGKIVVTK